MDKLFNGYNISAIVCDCSQLRAKPPGDFPFTQPPLYFGLEDSAEKRRFGSGEGLLLRSIIDSYSLGKKTPRSDILHDFGGKWHWKLFHGKSNSSDGFCLKFCASGENSVRQWNTGGCVFYCSFSRTLTYSGQCRYAVCFVPLNFKNGLELSARDEGTSDK